MSSFESKPNNAIGSSGPKKAVEPLRGDIDVEDIYQQTGNILRDSVNAGEAVLYDGPPASGKTTTIWEIISESDGQYTYLTKRKDLYDQAEDLGRKYGVSTTVIPSPHRHCPSFDSVSSHYHPEANELHHLGVRAGPLHDLLDLTCTPDCSYQQFWEDFDAAEHRVLVGHYKHAYIPSVVEDRTVIIDEFPGDAFERSFEDAPKMVGRFLKDTNGMPFDDWDDLINADFEQEVQAYEWFARYGVEATAEAIVDSDKSARYHSITPFLTWTVLESQKGSNGFSIPWFNLLQSGTISTAFGELDNNRRVAIDHSEREIHLLTQPDLGDVKGVIGLDGTPLPEQWELVTGEDFDRKSLFGQIDDLNAYVHDILGVTIRQTNNHLKPYHGGHVTANRDEAILYGVEVKEGQKPAVIAPDKALEAYREAGILERASRSMNYARVLSSNAFKSELVGVIHGAPHPGDATLKKWAAYFGTHIEGKGEGMDKSYGDFGDEIYRHFVHNQVLQAILRFGRGESPAMVYVNTAAIPDWLDIDAKENVKLFNTHNKRAIADHLRDVGEKGATKEDLKAAVEVSSMTTVENILTEFQDADIIKEEQQPDWPYRKIFRWSL